jgi:hypothetical protein
MSFYLTANVSTSFHMCDAHVLGCVADLEIASLEWMTLKPKKDWQKMGHYEYYPCQWPPSLA